MSGIIQSAQSASQTISSRSAGVTNVGYGYYPGEGSRCVTTQYSWLAQLAYAEDLSQLVALGVETTIQSVYVDNADNPQTVTITVPGTGQVVKIPGGSQGVYPLFLPDAASVNIITSALINATTRIYWLNMPISPASWSPAAGVPTLPSVLTVAVGGTAVGPWGARKVTGGGFIYNPTSNGVIPIYVDLVTTAQVASPGTNGSTVDLAPGDSLPIPVGLISVSINCATAGTPFVAFGMGVL